jgi:hypothetical protein
MDPNISGAPAAETPSAPPPSSASVDLAEYRRTKGEPSATPSPAPVDEAPDPEVEGNAELRAEIDKLEAPKDNETPAEKAARTRKHKEAARKGYQTRLANKATRATQENEQLRRENEALRRRAPAPAGREGQPPVDARPAARTPETTPDPKPVFHEWAKANSLDAFIAKHPDHPDHYAGWQQEFRDAVDDWKDRKAESTQRQQARERRVQQANAQYEQDIAAPVREKYADYDATTTQMIDAIAGTWIDDEIGTFLQKNPKVGGEVLYRMANGDAKAAQAAASQGRQEFIAFMADLRSRVTAESAGSGKKPEAAPLVSAAPAPVAPVAAASVASSSFDVTKSTGSVEDYRRSRARERAR